MTWRVIGGMVLMMPTVCAALVVLSGVWAVPLNDLRLDRMALGFDRHAHPADSEGIALVSMVGLLDGSGNHCDFLVGQWRRSEATTAQLLAHYTDPALSLYRPSETGGMESYAPASVRVSDIPDDPGAYLVYEYDGMSSPDGDLRCW